MKLRSLEVLRSSTRISSVDVFRAFAILPVVIYHFNEALPYGFLGVDLFFVISGLLVGSILIKKFKKNEKVSFTRFILQRGFKIWPSYYSFLLLGSLVAYLFYNKLSPGYILSDAQDSLRYFFFYQNYTGSPYHGPFDHIWSLCVEEHFYILLPLLFLFVIALFGYNRKLLLLSVAGLILAGILFKIFSFRFMPDISTYSTTHNKIDALGWGVLLGILVKYHEQTLRKIKWLKILFPAGVLLLAICIYILARWKDPFFEKAIFFSLSPFCFFLMILGLYYHDFSKWTTLRFIGYYSYNWYLWHPMFVLLISTFIGVNGPGLVIYITVSFLVAMIFTILVEERFLAIRENVLNWIFKKRTSKTQIHTKVNKNPASVI